jgi:hypothetical protein
MKMVKLKIGTGTTTKKKEPEKKDDYLSELSDEELEAMQIEVNSDINNGIIDQIIQDEVKESVDDEVSKLISDDDEEMKDAVDGLHILKEVGIKISYATKYLSLFPNKKIIYQSFFTKAFLKWYITNVKFSLLKDLYVIESESIKPEHREEIKKLITKRLKKPIEFEDFCDSDVIDLELNTELDSKMYEFLLRMKWDKKERALGITQLDKILEEQINLKDCDMTQALKNVITGFKLETKWYNLDKKEVVEKPEPNESSQAEWIQENDKSIKRFNHIKFLYELMGSPKMEFMEDLTDEEFKHIQAIDHLLNDREELKKAEEIKNGVDQY